MPSNILKKVLKITSFSLLLGGFLLLYGYYNPSQSSFFLSCPFKKITGYHCPGCGSQRAIHQLLHFNFLAAFRLNPLMVLSLPLIFYGLGLQVYNFIFETNFRVQLFYHKWFIYGYFGMVVLYWIVRNLPYYPFNLLAPTIVE